MFESTAFSAVIRVKPGGNDASSGASWALAKATVQAAIDAAAEGDEIWVAWGTYPQRLNNKVIDEDINGGDGTCWGTSTWSVAGVLLFPGQNVITVTAHGRVQGGNAGSAVITVTYLEPLMITGLIPGLTYHVRAYATSSAGTSYGDNVTFTTQSRDYSVPLGEASGSSSWPAD